MNDEKDAKIAELEIKNHFLENDLKNRDTLHEADMIKLLLDIRKYVKRNRMIGLISDDDFQMGRTNGYNESCADVIQYIEERIRLLKKQ